MDKNEEIGETTKLEGYFGHGVTHHGGRPMKMVKDKEGNWWVCDKNADPNKDPKKQGCWSCDQLIFTRGG